MMSASEGWAIGDCTASGQCEFWHYQNGTWSEFANT
jgi:hypothetical protein